MKLPYFLLHQLYQSWSVLTAQCDNFQNKNRKSEMTILCAARPQLWTREVPGGWRIVNIRQGGSITPYYLSPEGRRFSSLQAVRTHVATFKQKRTEVSEAEKAEGEIEEKEVSPTTEKSNKKRKRKRKRTQTCEGSVAKRLKLEEDSDQQDLADVDLSIPPEIQKRRKLMALRSPFRNLLKRTLVRNHIRMKGRMTMMISKAEVVKRDKPSQYEENNSPPSKRLKLDTIPPQEASCSSDSELKTESKSDKNLLSTPPKKIKREMHLFPPPNLTPPVLGPVVRRPTTISFSQPNQRNVLTRKVAVNVKTVRGEAQ